MNPPMAAALRAAPAPELRPRLRIAMVTETYPPEVNGVARTVGLMAEGLHARGHHIQLVRPKQHRDDKPAPRDGFEELLVLGIPIPRYTQLKMGAPAKGLLGRSWLKTRPDLVHIATEGPLGWSALAAARELGIPVATDFHTNFHTYSRHYGFAWLARGVTAYLRRFHNRAGCTLVPTAELAQELERAGYRGLGVVGRGVNPAVFHPERRSAELRESWGASDDTLVALCVSRFAPEKNFPLVIRAYEAMRRVREDTRLVLVGDGPMAEELRANNVGIVVAGRKVNGELSRHYASADVFLFASTTETFGNVTLEAMASGLGVVAYSYAAARAHLEHNRSALLAPFDDEASFVAHAERFAREPGLARRRGRVARAAAEHVTWERIVGDFEEALLDAASAARR
jgi:glycosyltransferase involved in cell wall biosynthesis